MSRYLRNAFLPPIALATILAGGALVVWAIAVGFVGALSIARSVDGQVNEHLQILNNGQAVIFVPERARSHSTITYLTLDHQVTTLDAVVGEERTSSRPASLGEYMVGSGHLAAPGDGGFRSDIARAIDHSRRQRWNRGRRNVLVYPARKRGRRTHVLRRLRFPLEAQRRLYRTKRLSARSASA